MTVSIPTTRLSSVITGWGGNETTCSRRSSSGFTRSTNGTMNKNTAMTMSAINPASIGYSSLRDERRGAPDLDHMHALAHVDGLVLVVGARRPHLAVDPHAADALVVGDPLDHHAGPPHQRGRAGAQPRRLPAVRASDRPQRGQEHDRD